MVQRLFLWSNEKQTQLLAVKHHVDNPVIPYGTLWRTVMDLFPSFAIKSRDVKLRIIHNWARYMISYFNPHYLFRGWAIIADIMFEWFAIFSVFLLFKVKVLINILKRKWIESNQKFTYFSPSPKQQKPNQILLSLNVWSLKICHRRNENNFPPATDKQSSACNKQLTQEIMTILKVNLQCQVRTKFWLELIHLNIWLKT